MDGHGTDGEYPVSHRRCRERATSDRTPQSEQEGDPSSLEGLVVERAGLDPHERAALGLLTPEEALALYLRLAGAQPQ